MGRELGTANCHRPCGGRVACVAQFFHPWKQVWLWITIHTNYLIQSSTMARSYQCPVWSILCFVELYGRITHNPPFRIVSTTTSEWVPKAIGPPINPLVVGSSEFRTLHYASLPREVACTENLTPWAKVGSLFISSALDKPNSCPVVALQDSGISSQRSKLNFKVRTMT